MPHVYPSVCLHVCLSACDNRLGARGGGDHRNAPSCPTPRWSPPSRRRCVMITPAYSIGPDTERTSPAHSSSRFLSLSLSLRACCGGGAGGAHGPGAAEPGLVRDKGRDLLLRNHRHFHPVRVLRCAGKDEAVLTRPVRGGMRGDCQVHPAQERRALLLRDGRTLRRRHLVPARGPLRRTVCLLARHASPLSGAATSLAPSPSSSCLAVANCQL
eukprot:COSAG01_NODE_5254_length_4380_cov_3.719823_4_plen_214_part_00